MIVLELLHLKMEVTVSEPCELRCHQGSFKPALGPNWKLSSIYIYVVSLYPDSTWTKQNLKLKVSAIPYKTVGFLFEHI